MHDQNIGNFREKMTKKNEKEMKKNQKSSASGTQPIPHLPYKNLKVTIIASKKKASILTISLNYELWWSQEINKSYGNICYHERPSSGPQSTMMKWQPNLKPSNFWLEKMWIFTIIESK